MTGEKNPSIGPNPKIKSFYKDVYDKYFAQYSPADDHIDSFNKFIRDGLVKIIYDYNPIEASFPIVQDGKSMTVTARITIQDPIPVLPHCMASNRKKKAIYPTAVNISDKTYNIHIHAHSVFELYTQVDKEPVKLVKRVDSRSGKTGPMVLAKIPTMVMSDYCSLAGSDENTREKLGEDRYELGGYYIVKGKEYYILTQENKAGNFIYKNIDLRNNKEKEYKVWIQSKITNKYDYPYYTLVKLTKASLKKDGSKDELISVAVTISKPRAVYMPLKIFFKAIGVITDKEMFEMIVHKKGEKGSILQDISSVLMPSLQYVPSDATHVKTQNDAILYIGREYAKKHYRGYEYGGKSDEELLKSFKSELLNKLFLPHLGGLEAQRKKQIFLGNMVRKAINMRLGIEDEIDKDNYGNKRLLAAGEHYGYLVKFYYNMIVSDVKKKLISELKLYSPEKSYVNIVSRIWDESKMSKIATNISKGEWPVGTSKMYTTKKGVTQHREMLSRSATIAILERVITPLDPNAKGQMMNVHMAQMTNWGVIDISNTPDGGNIGIVKHKTFLLKLSLFENPSIYYKIFGDISGIIRAEDIEPKTIEDCTSIFINGSLDFFISRGKTRELHRKLIKLRREGKGRMNSIVCDYESWELRIYTDTGRCLRPLYVVDAIQDPKTGLVKNKLRITPKKAKSMSWDELIKDGCIEYISIHEAQYNAYIAFSNTDLDSERYKKYTHCEIDGTAILSLNSLGIKLIERMQSPRAVYQNTMQKQTIGLPCTNYMHRTDNSLNILCYPQRPIFNTIGDVYMKRDKLPAGNMIIIALGTFTG